MLSSRRMAAGDTGRKPGCCLCWRDAATGNCRPRPSSSTQGFARAQDLRKCGATLCRVAIRRWPGPHAQPLTQACEQVHAMRKAMMRRCLLPVCCRYAAATQCHTLPTPGCHSLSSSGLQRTPSSTCAVSLASSQTAGVCPALLPALHAVESLHMNQQLLRRHTINAMAVCRPVI